jgi:PAS domain S-box-containing protein
MSINDNLELVLRYSAEQTIQLHQRAMDSSSCGITIADASLPDIPLIYINRSFEIITGYSAAETLGRNCRFLQREDRYQPEIARLRQALARGQDCMVTLRNYRRDGSLFWNELMISPILNDDRQLTHFVGIQTDITERRKAQEALESALAELRETQMLLIHAEKMNALGQMVAGIAHEINNPVSFVNSNLFSLQKTLSTVFGAYDQLEQRILTDVETLTEVQAIRRNADLDFVRRDMDDLLNASLEGLDRVKRIVQELRTFARLDEAEFKFASLEECVRSALLIASGEIGNRIQTEVRLAHLSLIYCCPAELNQVFLNLIVNAAQSIPDTGKIVIEGIEERDTIRLIFTDSGCGMSEDVINNIFTPFFTTKPPGVGVGLGLAIAYKIITDRHKGVIQVASEVGKGSRFTLIMPKDIRQ